MALAEDAEEEEEEDGLNEEGGAGAVARTTELPCFDNGTGRSPAAAPFGAAFSFCLALFSFMVFAAGGIEMGGRPNEELGGTLPWALLPPPRVGDEGGGAAFGGAA